MLLWLSCHYKRDIKHHRKPSAQLTAAVYTGSAIEYCTHTTNENGIVWLSCDFQLQRWCGLAIVVLEGRPEQQQAGLESFFPLEANRMSLMNHSMFELSHLTILGTQPSSLACTTRKREKHSEMRNMQEKKKLNMYQIQEMPPPRQRPQIKCWS